MDIPFYNGINGQSFQITHVFENFAELQEDENQGWNSVYPVGSFYTIGKNDSADGSTLWQKTFSKDLNRIVYQCIGSFKGESELHIEQVPETEYYKLIFDYGESSEASPDDSSYALKSDLVNYVKISDINNYISNNAISQGDLEAYIANNITSVPNGGTEGQVLTRDSNNNLSWTTINVNSVTVDNNWVTNSENPIQSKIIKSALDGKASQSDLDTLTATVSNKVDKTITDGLQGEITTLQTSVQSNTTSINNIRQVPANGTTGQILTKTANGYDWGTISSDGSGVDLSNYVTQTDLQNNINSLNESIQNRATQAELSNYLKTTVAASQYATKNEVSAIKAVPNNGNVNDVLTKTTNGYEWKAPPISSGSGGDGTSITIDTALDPNSSNPVTNSAISIAVAGKLDIPSNSNSATIGMVLTKTNDSTEWQALPTSGGSGEGTSITIDTELDDDSTNPVQNQVIANALKGIHGIPVGGSQGAVLTKSSGADYDTTWSTVSTGGDGSTIVIDSTLSASSQNAVANSVITAALLNCVPTTRTINGNALSSDITLNTVPDYSNATTGQVLTKTNNGIGWQSLSSSGSNIKVRIQEFTFPAGFSGMSSSINYRNFTFNDDSLDTLENKFVFMDLNFAAGETNATYLTVWQNILNYGPGYNGKTFTLYTTATSSEVDGLPFKVVVIG